MDNIFNMLDWNNSKQTQNEGIAKARQVSDISVFLQPNSQTANKNVWGNCAMILSEKSDGELLPYINRLFEWLQDMNWPGANCILERLKKFAKSSDFENAFTKSVNIAKSENDEIWLENLMQIRIDK